MFIFWIGLGAIGGGSFVWFLKEDIMVGIHGGAAAVRKIRAAADDIERALKGASK